MKHTVGNKIELNSSIHHFASDGPYEIIASKADEYVILVDEGWEITNESIKEYKINKKLLGKNAWIVDEKAIKKGKSRKPSAPAWEDFLPTGTKCLCCSTTFNFAFSSLNEFVCHGCSDKGKWIN